MVIHPNHPTQQTKFAWNYGLAVIIISIASKPNPCASVDQQWYNEGDIEYSQHRNRKPIAHKKQVRLRMIECEQFSILYDNRIYGNRTVIISA